MSCTEESKGHQASGSCADDGIDLRANEKYISTSKKKRKKKEKNCKEEKTGERQCQQDIFQQYNCP